MKFRKQTLAALVGAALIGAASMATAQQPGGMMGAQGSGTGMMSEPGAGASPGMMGTQSGAAAPTSGNPCPGYGMGPGMMGGGGFGMGPGMMGGGGYGMGPGMMMGGGGYGMGPGMMGGGGYGMGPGMMMGGGGYGMGPGMMGGGGYGMGPGMMGGGGYGMGPGMMGYGPLQALNLSDEQRSKIGAIEEELQRKVLDLGDKAAEQALKLRQLSRAEKPDRQALAGAYRRLLEVRQESFEARLDAREKIEGALTTEQRQQLRRWGPSWITG